MTPRDRLIVALDRTDRTELLALADALESHAGLFKLGPIAFNRYGPELVQDIARRRPVFLDLKLHDIPNTVAGGVAPIAALGVDLLTIHASGGRAMIAAAVAAAGSAKVVTVTVLTSLLPLDLKEIGCDRQLHEQVLRLATLARSSGAAGVVCAPQEVETLRAKLGPEALLVVPGIRPAGSDHGDQRRVATPAQAVAAGATYIVVGRPIIDDPAPADAARRILDELATVA